MYVKNDILKIQELLLSLIGKEIMIREYKSEKGLKIIERRYLLYDISEKIFTVEELKIIMDIDNAQLEAYWVKIWL